MLAIVGIGPGDRAHMTYEAAEALERAEVVAGYSGYIRLVKPLYPEKEYVETGMRAEMERCREALSLAAAGREVALVCSGDAGIYGMAGLVYELAERDGLLERVELRVVAGVTAALAASALLGAPLGHDLALISLSDLMTPWELIERRLAAAAEADFCIALYNPSSRTRGERFRRACEILLQYRGGEQPCGIAERIGREGERAQALSLAELAKSEPDMQSIVLVGNSQTRLVGSRLVTPRGYLEKYGSGTEG